MNIKDYKKLVKNQRTSWLKKCYIDYAPFMSSLCFYLIKQELIKRDAYFD